MKALIIGGDRHGDWVDVLDGAQAWVDIRTAVTHRIRKLTWNVQDIRSGAVTEAYVLHAAVHEELVGPSEPQVVGELLRMLTMNEFARTHGEKQELPHEPSAAERLTREKL
jgi:hypothetical protein